jgi:hypothetical protein
MEEVNMTWAIVAATFIGPVIAVLITLWYQRTVGWKDAKRSIYATMMRSRLHPISPDFVGSFNLVPVYYHNDKKVMEKYRIVLDIFADANWNNIEAQPRLNQKVVEAIVQLLSKMSKSVRLPIEQLDILSGAYAPRGWADDEIEQRQLRSAMIEVLTGQRLLPVKIVGDAEVKDDETTKFLSDLPPSQKNSDKL